MVIHVSSIEAKQDLKGKGRRVGVGSHHRWSQQDPAGEVRSEARTRGD